MQLSTIFIRLQAAVYKVYFIISCGLQSRAAYIFYSFTLSQDINDAQSFLGKFCRPNYYSAFDFLQHHVHIRHKRGYDKKTTVVVVQQQHQWYGKRTSTRTSRMHLRGFGNLCSSTVYNQGQLTLIFNTISCGLQSKAANNRVNKAGT